MSTAGAFVTGAKGLVAKQPRRTLVVVHTGHTLVVLADLARTIGVGPAVATLTDASHADLARTALRITGTGTARIIGADRLGR